MQIQSKDSSSCTDVEPLFGWHGEDLSIGFKCSHGTILWVHMNRQEAAKLAFELNQIVTDMEDNA